MGGDLSLETLHKEVQVAVQDFKEALKTHDFATVILDLKEDLRKRGPNDNGFEQTMDKVLHDQGILPNLFLEGLDDKGHLILKNVKGDKIILDEQGKDASGRTPIELSFAMVDGQYNPVRPSGIGEFKPGVITAHGWHAYTTYGRVGIDSRTGKTTSNSDSSATFEYTGNVSGKPSLSAVPFKASESIDKDGKVIETHVDYSGPLDQTFIGPTGGPVTISDVRQMDTTRDQDGYYVTKVTNLAGKVWTFTTSSEGKVLRMKKPD